MEEEEVVLGLIPAPDWVENRPLEEGSEIERAAAKKLQHSQEAEQMVEIKPKKEEEGIEEITLYSEEEEEEEESREVKIKPEEVFKIEAGTPFHTGNEGAEIETTEEKHRIAVPIVFSAAKEGAEMKIKEEEPLQIEPSAVFPEAEENEEVNMHAEEEEPHIEAVTVFSDSDEGESIHIKEEEELQIEAVTVYSDSDQSEEDSLLGQENERYNIQDDAVSVSPFTLSLGPPQATIIETAVQDVYGCNSCSSSFSSTGELSKHVRYHPSRSKPFVCRVCLKTDSLEANLERHMRTHSGEKQFFCVLCLKTLTSAYSLKIHMRIHSGYKPYSCKKCPRAFYQKIDLNKHDIVHLRAENKDSNSGKQNLKPRKPLTEKVLSRVANSRVPKILPRPSHVLPSPQLSVVPVNRNMKTDNSRTVNSQTKSPSNTLRDSPVPFASVVTEVVSSFREEDSEMQPCPPPSNNREPQKRVAFHPINLVGNRITVEKAVSSQPVINSVNTQVADNTGALQDIEVPVSSSEGKQFAVNKSVYEQPEMYSVSSQNEANSDTSILSPVQLTTNVVQNNANSAASAHNTAFANNFANNQPGGEIFCFPLIINGQMCYTITASTASQLVVNNPALAQTAVQPMNSHTVSTPETFLIPLFVPPISNGVPSPNLSQPIAAPAVTPQASVLGNATSNQPQPQVVFQSAPVSTVTCVRPENSSGSQMTIMNTVPCLQPENSIESRITSLEPVPHGQLENSVASQMTTVKTVPEMWPENFSRSHITTMETVLNSQPENSMGSQMTAVENASHGLPSKQFIVLPAPVTLTDVNPVLSFYPHL